MKILRMIFVFGLLVLIASCVMPASQPPDAHVTGASRKYDNQFVEMVSSNWFGILDSEKPDLKRGKVVLCFYLHSDGNITDLKVKSSDVSGEQTDICKKAVWAGNPYPNWPADVVEALKTNYCDVQFTFDYYESRRKFF